MSFWRILAVLFVCSVLMVGCLVPRNFTFEVDATESGLEFTYDGEIVVAPVYLSEREISAKDKQGVMDALEDDIRKQVAEMNGSYTGSSLLNGLITARFTGTKLYRDCVNSDIAGVFEIRHLGDGVFALYSQQSDHDTLMKYEQSGHDLDDLSGTACFRPGEGVTVVEHNADMEPSFLTDCYSWNMELGKGDQMVVAFQVESVRAEIEKANVEKQKQLDAIVAQAKATRLEQLDQYVSDLIGYREAALKAREKAARSWDNVQLKNSGTSVRTEEKYGDQRVYMEVELDITNGNGFPVKFGVTSGIHYIVKTPAGEVLLDDHFLLKGEKRTLSAKETKAIVESERLRDVEKDPVLFQALFSGKCLVSFFLEEIRPDISGVHGELEPDGSPFLPDYPPRAPDRDALFDFQAGLDIDYDKEMEKFVQTAERMIKAKGGPGPLEEVREASFSKPTNWSVLSVAR